jgi:hypothetical protein
MNRRLFFAGTLPALLGFAASRTSAEAKPQPEPSRRRVRIEVSFLKPTFRAGDTNAHIIQTVTEEDVAAYAAFLQMYTYQITGGTSTSQAFGPSLRVTPRIDASGRITLDGRVQYEEAASGAVSGQPLPLNSGSQTFLRTVESGEPVTLGSRSGRRSASDSVDGDHPRASPMGLSLSGERKSWPRESRGRNRP